MLWIRKRVLQVALKPFNPSTFNSSRASRSEKKLLSVHCMHSDYEYEKHVHNNAIER